MSLLRIVRWAIVFALWLWPLVSPPAKKPPAVPRLLGQTLDEFAERRAKVREAADGALVLLHSAIVQDDDQERVRFRADSNMVYLTGVEVSGAWLALLPPDDPSGLKEILFLPPLNPRISVFDDPVPGPNPDTERQTGIAAVRSTAEMWRTLTPSLMNAKTVLIMGATGDTARFTPNADLEARLLAINAKLTVKGRAELLIHALRVKKSAGELANIRAAIATTIEAERAAARIIHPGVTELTVEGAILAAYRARDSEREAFPCIVGSGPNSVILHHYAGTRKMQANETVVVDIGAEYHCYAADITRTFPAGGHFTRRQRQIYQLVLDTQRACERAVVPGKTTPLELYRIARAFLKSSPLRARDAKGKLQTMDTFFMHGLGHQMGLEVHDVYERLNKPYETGMTFTIEPGIYIASEGFGVRIEDDYLVRLVGVEKLTRALPSDIAGVEAMMRPAKK